MKILQINSSARAESSHSTRLASALVERLRADQQAFYFPCAFGQLAPEGSGLHVTVQAHIKTPTNLCFEPLHATPNGRVVEFQ